MKYFVSFLMFCNHLDGEKRAGCFALSSWCLVTVSSLWHSVLWLFLAVRWVGLWCVIVVFSDHAHFLFFQFSMLDHYFSMPVSYLCCEGGEVGKVVKKMDHDNVEKVRMISSFRR